MCPSNASLENVNSYSPSGIGVEGLFIDALHSLVYLGVSTPAGFRYFHRQTDQSLSEGGEALISVAPNNPIALPAETQRNIYFINYAVARDASSQLVWYKNNGPGQLALEGFRNLLGQFTRLRKCPDDTCLVLAKGNILRFYPLGTLGQVNFDNFLEITVLTAQGDLVYEFSSDGSYLYGISTGNQLLFRVPVKGSAPGTVESLGSSPGIVSPSAIAVHPTAPFLYIGDRGVSPGRIYQYRIIEGISPSLTALSPEYFSLENQDSPFLLQFIYR